MRRDGMSKNIGWRGLATEAASHPHEHDNDPRRYTRRHRRFIAAETRAQATEALAERAECSTRATTAQGCTPEPAEIPRIAGGH
jgi:hypothetical protein